MQSVDFSRTQAHTEEFLYHSLGAFPLYGKLSGGEAVQLLDDGALQGVYRSIIQEHSNDLARGLRESSLVLNKIERPMSFCQGAAQIVSFLRGKFKGWLPGAEESLSIRFPDLRQEATGSLEFKLIDRAGNTKSEGKPFDIISLNQAAAICWRRETEGEMCEDQPISKAFPGISDCLDQKYQPVLDLYGKKDLSLSEFKAGILCAAKVIKRPEHAECWNQTIARIEKVAQDTIQTNYDSLQEQIFGHLQDRCRIVHEGPEKYSFTVSDCDVPSLPASTSSVYALGLGAALLAGGLTALWIFRSRGKTDPLKSQIAELSLGPEKERADFLAKVDRLLVGGSGQFNTDRNRLAAVLEGEDGEWAHLSPNFKSLLSSCLKQSSENGPAGYWDAIHSRMSQAFRSCLEMKDLLVGS